VKRVHDVSLPIRSGGLVYPGNPQIDITLDSAVARGASSNLSKICFGSHTGTHIDAAKHFFDDGQTVDQIPLDRLIGPARLVAFDDSVMSVTATDLKKHDLAGQARIIIRTRNSGFNQETEFHTDYTYLAPDGAEYLVSLGVQLVGVDYLSIEQFHSGHHRTHRALLEKSVVIVEGLNLEDVDPGDYDLICLPIRLEGIDGAPARAVLIER
jgi:arylformamidase